jgi:hypothetical protein
MLDRCPGNYIESGGFHLLHQSVCTSPSNCMNINMHKTTPPVPSTLTLVDTSTRSHTKEVYPLKGDA